MAETKTGALSQAVHPLIERARTSTVPIAALIGFDVEEIGAGRAVASLQTGPQHRPVTGRRSDTDSMRTSVAAC